MQCVIDSTFTYFDVDVRTSEISNHGLFKNCQMTKVFKENISSLMEKVFSENTFLLPIAFRCADKGYEYD